MKDPSFCPVPYKRKNDSELPTNVNNIKALALEASKSVRKGTHE